ncbi:olfactory receptor 52L1-like [Thomomys bottae]
MFFLALTGNGVLVSLIWTDHRLHQPMFVFLAMLSFVDLVLSLSTLPKMLAIFWFGATAIRFHFCLVQMFFIHSFSAMESGVLVAMAFDRFVAICSPLHYTTTLTPGVVTKIGGLAVLRGVGLTIFFPILAHRLSFCGSHTIAYTYCEHMAMVKLACGDTAVDSLYAFAVALFLGVGDVAFIAYSYGQIVNTVLHFSSPEARAKAGSTCTAHVCVILFFYGPGFLSVVMQRFGPPTASSAKVILANLYLLFPPALDPIVYGVKTKQIRERLFTIIYPQGKQSNCEEEGKGDLISHCTDRTPFCSGEAVLGCLLETILKLVSFPSFLSRPLIMALSNSSWRLPQPLFFLVGIPGLEESQHWIALPLGVLFCLALVGNVTILFIIWSDSSLHQPMYIFLAMLAAIDLVLASSTAPKALAVLLARAREIGYVVCSIQMFFIHAFSSMESGVLVAMALDRYVAICHPLHHSTILHAGVIARLGIAVLVRGALLLIPFPILLRHLVFCQATVIGHAYCEHMAVVKLACSETIVNRAYGLSVALFVVGLDVLAIGVSYALILRAVLKAPGVEGRLKALSTCGSHVCVILIFYVPGMFSFLTHRFGHQVPHHVHVLLATLYLLVPPALNPLVYGVKTQQIRQRVLRVFYVQGWS